MTVTNPDYYYFRKGHLGNNREVWLANTGATVQRTQYYPSGLPWAESTGQAEQNKKYNGKEFVEAHGLDEYDSEARWYYPAIMRTTTLDPLAEKYYSISPYAWCGNNPVNIIDPYGLAGEHPMVGADGLTNEEWLAKTSHNPDAVNNYLATLSPDSYVSPTFQKYVNKNNYDYEISDEYYASYAGFEYHGKDYNVFIGYVKKKNKKLKSPSALSIGGSMYNGLEKMTVSKGYWLGKNGKYCSTNWGGNQWTGARSGAFKIAKVYKAGGTITTVLAGGASIGYGIYQDSQLNGGQFTFGNNAGRATAGVAGGVAGGMIGAEIGAGIGVWFDGVGAIPGAVIGGAVGSIIGGWGGSSAGEAIYDEIVK